MRPFILCFILLWAVSLSFLGVSQKKATLVAKSPQEELVERAEYYLSIGDYFRASNLYKYCLTALVYVENEEEIRKKFNFSKQLYTLQNRLYSAIIAGNETQIQTLSDEILRLNPKDRIANMGKETPISAIARKTSESPPKPTNSPPLEPSITLVMKKARQLNNSGKKQEAIAILQPYKGNEEVDRLIDAIKRENVKPPVADSKPCDEARYTALKNQMNVLYASCRLEDAKSKALFIRQMECYQNDRSALRIFDDIQDIQQGLRNIATWRSGGDVSKREFIIPEYERIFKKNRNCVEWDYFYYVYWSAERMRTNDPCNKEIIPRLLTAQRISPALAQKENISQKITTIENCINCEDKINLFISVANSAKERYRRCQYDEATALYDEAQKILASCTSAKVEQLMKEWGDIKIEIEANRRITTRFNWLKTAADSLRALDQCEVAYQYYLAADSLQTKCGVLVKTDLTKKLVNANCCRINQIFDNLLDSSKRAQRLNLFRDGSRLADSALVIGRLNSECVSLQKIKSLEDYICQTYKRECPPPPLPPIDTTSYRGIELVSGAFYNNPTLSSSVRSNLPAWGWGGLSGGVNYVVGNKYGELKIGALFTQNHFEIQNQFAENEKFDFQSIRVGADANIRLIRKIRTYPFVSLGGFGNFPLNFSYKSSLNLNSVEGASYLSGSFGFRAGLGVAIKNRIAVALTYDRVGLIEEGSFKASLAPLYLDKSIYQTFGVNVSYRLVKKIYIKKSASAK